MHTVFFLAACSDQAPLTATDPADCCAKGTVYEVPELSRPPMFPGGDGAMYAWLGNRLNRPREAGDVKEGPLVQFHVTCTGNLRDIAIKVPAHPAMDSLALKAVREMPTWTPGKIKDRAVCTFHVVQVHFD